MTETKEVKSKAIGDYRSLDEAMLDYQRSGDIDKDHYLEVTKSFFEALARGQKSSYLTYGNPGVKIFIEGTRPDILKEESMSLEELRARDIERMREARVKK